MKASHVVLAAITGLAACLVFADITKTSNDCTATVDFPVWFGGKACITRDQVITPPLAVENAEHCVSTIDFPVWFGGKACVQKEED